MPVNQPPLPDYPEPIAQVAAKAVESNPPQVPPPSAPTANPLVTTYSITITTPSGGSVTFTETKQ